MTLESLALQSSVGDLSFPILSPTGLGGFICELRNHCQNEYSQPYPSFRRPTHPETLFSTPTKTDQACPADLAACRTRKAGFNAAQGDFGDAPQLCLRCPVGSLNAKACHDRRQVTGKVRRLDFCREFTFRLGLLQALLESRFTVFSPIDHRKLYLFCIRATCQCPLDRKAAPRIVRAGEELRSSMDQLRYDLPQRGLS